MAVPALNIPIRANVDQFQRDMNKAADTASKAALQITSKVVAMNASLLASQGAAGVATLALGRVLGVAGPIALAITAVKDTFDFLRYSVKLAGERIEEFNGISARAASANVTTEFCQRIEKAAKGAGLSIDDSAEALKRFNDATNSKLGGSDLERRLKELRDAGNLSGNSGLAQFGAANGTEERFRAIVRLIDEAMQKGERLAALDIAEKAFGAKVSANLKADAGYLDDMLARADAINKAEIVSEADVSRAIQLKERMEEAHKILADKWKPIQNDIAELGINFKENTTAIVEKFAELVGLANQLYSALKSIPDLFAQLGNSPIWSRLMELTGSLGLNSDPAALGIDTGIDVQRAAANDKLKAALQNRANMMRAMQQTSDVQTAVRGDQSRKSAPASGRTEASAFDTAAASIERHTARVNADASAVGLGAAALDQMRARATLLTAAQQAGIEPTAEMTAKIDRLAKAAGEAAQQLAKAKVNSEIDFGRKTSLLSSEDISIATSLRSIYGNDVQAALASSEAAAMRLNEAFRGLAGSIETNLASGLTDVLDGTKSVSAGFADMGKAIVRALEEAIIKMMIVQPLMRSLSGAFGFADGGIVSTSSTVMVGEYAMPKFAGGGAISGPGTGRSDSIDARVSNGEFIVNVDATAKHRATLEAINAGLPKFADGGLVGAAEAGPAMLGGGSTTIAPTVSVTVQGSPGMSAADHEAMGKRVGDAAMVQIQKMIAKELRTQSRPGGVLRR